MPGLVGQPQGLQRCLCAQPQGELPHLGQLALVCWGEIGGGGGLHHCRRGCALFPASSSWLCCCCCCCCAPLAPLAPLPSHPWRRHSHSHCLPSCLLQPPAGPQHGHLLLIQLRPGGRGHPCCCWGRHQPQGAAPPLCCTALPQLHQGLHLIQPPINALCQALPTAHSHADEVHGSPAGGAILWPQAQLQGQAQQGSLCSSAKGSPGGLAGSSAASQGCAGCRQGSALARQLCLHSLQAALHASQLCWGIAAPSLKPSALCLEGSQGASADGLQARGCSSSQGAAVGGQGSLCARPQLPGPAAHATEGSQGALLWQAGLQRPQVCQRHSPGLLPSCHPSLHPGHHCSQLLPAPAHCALQAPSVLH